MPSSLIDLKRNAQQPVIGSSGGYSRLSWLGVGLFFTIWIAISGLGLVNSLILPSPMRVIGAFTDIGAVIFLHSSATILRILVGYVFGVVIGICVGTVMQYSRKAFVLLDGLVETFRPVPIVATVPFVILAFGFSEFGKIFIVVLGVSLVVIVNTIEAIDRVPTGLLRWGLVSEMSRISLFRNVILPAAWPEMRSGLRIALALAVSLVIVSEFMGATHGLGYLISVSKITLTTPTLFLCVIITGWIGWGFDRVIRLVFQKSCFWDIRAKGAIR